MVIVNIQCLPLHVGEQLQLYWVYSHVLAGPFSVQPIAAQFWRGRGRKILNILGKKTLYLRTPCIYTIIIIEQTINISKIWMVFSDRILTTIAGWSNYPIELFQYLPMKMSESMAVHHHRNGPTIITRVGRH